VRAGRAQRRWTLDELAAGSGVSRRLIVQIKQADANPSALDLYWIPIGAGGHGSVRFNGRVFEASKPPVSIVGAAISTARRSSSSWTVIPTQSKSRPRGTATRPAEAS
jgi:transcriptional regulator with XRE-family HTH domain